MIAELSNRLGRMFSAKEGRNGSVAKRVVAPSTRDRLESNALGSKQSPANVISILRAALSGDIKQQYQVYELMEDSWARLSKNLHELKSAAAGATYTVMPYTQRGEDPTPEAQQKADFIQHCIDNWVGNPVANTNGFKDAIYDLCDGVGKGFSVQEVIWEASAEGIRPKSTYFLHPRYYGFPYDQPDLMLSPNGDGVYEEFPANKFLIGIYKNRSGNSMGYGLMRQLAFWWSGQNYCRDWLLNFAQVFGQPLRWATYDPGAAAHIKNDIADMLENMGAAAWGAFPAGTQVEFKEAGKSGQDNPQSYFINLADKLCDIAILGQTLTTDVGDSGSRALGDVHQDVRISRLQDVCNWAANVLNEQLIPSICELNYGSHEDTPYLVPDLAGPGDPTIEATRDQILLNSGVAMPKEWFYDRHDVPVPEEGEEVVSAPVAAPSPTFAKSGVVEAAERAEPGARDKLLNTVIEDVTGVSEQWLAPVKPAFVQLVNKALDDELSDEDFERAITKAADSMPEMFDELDTSVLQDAMERSMGAAMVNGANKRYEQSPLPKVRNNIMAITNINSGIRVKLPNIEALKLDPDTITDVLTVGARATSNYLKKFYREKDSKEPNKLGGRRTHFWNRQIGGNVQLPVTEGGKVIVGIDSAILPHKVKGGTIKAKRVKYLTIPMIAEAYAKPARSFDDLVFAQNKKGTKMLGKVEKTGSAARKFNPKSAAKKKQPKTKVPQKKQKPLGLRVERSAASQTEEKKSNFKMYYLLKEQVTQKPWPNSIPTEEQIAEVSIKAMDKRINRLVERSLK